MSNPSDSPVQTPTQEVVDSNAQAGSKSPTNAVDNKNNKRIFIANIPLEATREEIEDLCNRFGRVLTIQLRRGKKSNNCNVTFMTHEDAEFVIYRLHRKLFKGQELRANWAEPIDKEAEAKRKEQENARRAQKDSQVKKKKKKTVTPMSLRNLTPQNAIGPSPTAAAKVQGADQFQGMLAVLLPAAVVSSFIAVCSCSLAWCLFIYLFIFYFYLFIFI
jgi:RNA recognition motif-containing protein